MSVECRRCMVRFLSTYHDKSPRDFPEGAHYYSGESWAVLAHSQEEAMVKIRSRAARLLRKGSSFDGRVLSKRFFEVKKQCDTPHPIYTLAGVVDGTQV